jgi:hypothetical protein
VRGPGKVFAWGALLAGLVGWAPAALAEERTFTVDYRAPNRCPPREKFLGEIARRTATARVAGPAEQPDIVMLVRLEQGRRARGRIEITAGTQTSERKVEGQSCAEVAGALALIAALAIDPLANSVFGLPPLPLPPDPHVPREVGTRLAIPLPNVPLPEGDPRAARPGRPPRLDEAALIEARPLPAFPYFEEASGRTLGVGPGALFALDVGPAPQPLVGAVGLVGIVSTAEIAWTLRAELAYEVSVADEALPAPSSDSLRFRMIRGRVEGCVPGWIPLDWLRLWPCANVGGGALWAELSRPAGDVVPTVEAASPWFVLGLGGRLEVLPTEWLGIDLRLGPDFPLVRGAFRTDTGAEIHVPAPATFSMSTGVGLWF